MKQRWRRPHVNCIRFLPLKAIPLHYKALCIQCPLICIYKKTYIDPNLCSFLWKAFCVVSRSEGLGNVSLLKILFITLKNFKLKILIFTLESSKFTVYLTQNNPFMHRSKAFALHVFCYIPLIYSQCTSTEIFLIFFNEFVLGKI